MFGIFLLALSALGDLSAAEARNRATAVSRSLQRQSAAFFESYWIAFESLAESDAIRDRDGPASDRLFARLLAQRPEIENFAAVGPNDAFFASSRPFDRAQPPSIAGLAFFKRSASGEKRVVMEPHRGPISGEPVTGAVVSLRGEGGSYGGLLGASIRIDRLTGIWRAALPADGIGVAVVSGGSEVFAAGPLAELARSGAPPRRGAVVVQDLAPFPGTATVVALPTIDMGAYLLGNPLVLASMLALLAAIAALVAFAFREDRRSAALARSLAEKKHLMGELHHRVKTSLSLVTAFLEFVGETAVPGTCSIDSVRRKTWVIALAHRSLYESGDLEFLALGPFLKGIAEGVREERSRPDIAVELTDSGGSLHIDEALPLGIVAAELVDNAFAHAFPGKTAGTVRLGAAASGAAGIRLVVSDDGVGLPGGAAEDGLGLFIAKLLCSQLEGSLRIESNGPGGTTCSLEFVPRRTR